MIVPRTPLWCDTMAGLCPSFPRGTVWNDSVYRDYVGTLVSPGKTKGFFSASTQFQNIVVLTQLDCC